MGTSNPKIKLLNLFSLAPNASFPLRRADRKSILRDRVRSPAARCFRSQLADWAQKEGVTEFVVAVFDALVEPLQCVDQRFDGEIDGMLGGKTAQHVVVGHKVDKGKAATQCVINQRNRAVGGVHGAEDAQVGRDAKERAVGGKAQRLITVFEQIHQLAKDAAEIGTVDLIDDEHAATVVAFGFAAEFEKAPRHNGKFHAAALGNGADALDKVFVFVGGVELDDVGESFGNAECGMRNAGCGIVTCDFGGGGCEMLGELGGDVGFADAGGTEEDGLSFALDGGDPGGEEAFVEEGGLADLAERDGGGEFGMRNAECGLGGADVGFGICDWRLCTVG